MLTVDMQRPGNTDRYLGDADEILDVPRQQSRIDGVAADMRQLGTGVLLNQVGSMGSHRTRVIVAAITGNVKRGPSAAGRHVIPPLWTKSTG